MREAVCAALVLAATGLAGCASVQAGAHSVQTGAQNVHDHIPFMYHEQKVAAGDPAPAQREAHRQYYDKLHKRYYYYDPVKKSYFWENGVPKD
jgi:outer membrane murein-binding lipoprotein Lpp